MSGNSEINADLLAEKSEADLEARLADLLAEIVDAPLMTVRDVSGSPRGLFLYSFRPDISERACELLEEAGR